jgi:hypothetical protein
MTKNIVIGACVGLLAIESVLLYGVIQSYAQAQREAVQWAKESALWETLATKSCAHQPTR